VDAQGLLRVHGKLARDLVSQLRVHAARLVHCSQLNLFVGRVVLEFVAFLVDLGVDQLVLRGHRHELARGHRRRAGRQPGQAGEHDRAMRAAAAADSGDQRNVGDQAVHGAEDRRAQPSAGRHGGDARGPRTSATRPASRS
jgi:hypothetical protein